MKPRFRCRLMLKYYTIIIMNRNACIMKNRLKISNVNPSIIAKEEKLKLEEKDSVEVYCNLYVFLISGYNIYSCSSYFNSVWWPTVGRTHHYYLVDCIEADLQLMIWVIGRKERRGGDSYQKGGYGYQKGGLRAAVPYSN